MFHVKYNPTQESVAAEALAGGSRDVESMAKRYYAGVWVGSGTGQVFGPLASREGCLAELPALGPECIVRVVFRGGGP